MWYFIDFFFLCVTCRCISYNYYIGAFGLLLLAKKWTPFCVIVYRVYVHGYVDREALETAVRGQSVLAPCWWRGSHIYTQRQRWLSWSPCSWRIHRRVWRRLSCDWIRSDSGRDEEKQVLYLITIRSEAQRCLRLKIYHTIGRLKIYYSLRNCIICALESIAFISQKLLFGAICWCLQLQQCYTKI